jgi:galactokinase
VKQLKKHRPEIKALRDVTIDELNRARPDLTDVVYHRCRHVITENDRTLRAAEFFKRHQLADAGKLMFESHHSLRDDYEVSCEELDVLVEFASNVKGVFGARMTGGGFGGCTVNIVRRGAVDQFEEEVRDGYEQRFGKAPDIYRFHAVDGASELTD